MNEINFKKIDKDNLELACQIQNEIFPKEDARQNYIDYNGNNPIGVTGIYSYPEYPNIAWLGWFGILKQFRNEGYGGITLDKSIELAKNKGYKEFRLYTDEY